MTDLSQRRILMLATDGFEEAELFDPRRMLAEAGATVALASPKMEPVRGVVYDAETGHSNLSQKTITPDLLLRDVHVGDYDALVLPGGVVNPDALRMNGAAIDIVRGFAEAGKPVAAICHAPWLLIEADLVRGRRSTGWYSVRTDLANAGSEVVDEAVVIDGNIITSRMPSDIPAFTDAVIKALGNT